MTSPYYQQSIWYQRYQTLNNRIQSLLVNYETSLLRTFHLVLKIPYLIQSLPV